ncbi:hypothetical protein B0J11DRAFT_270573 [Dendryphion nanum]|uniref:Uncharacterized protein n=1 Tax=Dendryphion nanum TaxID=256645 RepID=A0A9P9DZ46_9PLEO|nr:hypothetical protein B0J11DRAFT_270573 [Dendryphion nanum]
MQHYKKRCLELSKEMLIVTGQVPTLQTENKNLTREKRRLESDLKFRSSEADMYKNQVYGLQVELESVEARLNEENQTLKDRLRLVEGERDALKTNLKEEEVLRIAAEGSIPLPAATNDEHDDFGSPVRSPRKQRPIQRDEDDKENVAPKKGAVELKFIRQELAAEKRLRERAEDQIEFMKMECQFRCCSCRIADLKGSDFIHDDTYAAEMKNIKAAMAEITPPSSLHEDDQMEGVIINHEPLAVEPLAQTLADPEHASNPLPATNDTQDPALAFFPTTGTFRAVSSPIEVLTAMHITTPAKPSASDLSYRHAVAAESSPPDANGTMIHHEDVDPLIFNTSVQQEDNDDDVELASSENIMPSKNAVDHIYIHEDAVEESDDDEENQEPQTPGLSPSGPATPGQYLMRTVTTTTTIPIHFSPMTPAVRGSDKPMTPSTIAHAPTASQSQVLGEISMNKLPFDREAALEAIRQRRGRARSMAAGHGTPMKQMLDGLKDRRDISAPVTRVRPQ